MLKGKLYDKNQIIGCQALGVMKEDSFQTSKKALWG